MTAALVTFMSSNMSSEPELSAPAPLHRVWYYPAHPRSAGAARRDVAAQLRLWELDELVDAAVLVVSELATNAVLASHPADNQDGHDEPASRVALRLTYSHQDVIVEMWDGAADRPIRRVEDLTADNGRGLHLVAALARDWGYYRVRVGDMTNGKVVWAALLHGKPPIGVVADAPPASRDLPRRSPSPPSSDGVPDPGVSDRALQRVIDGLRALDGWTRRATPDHADAHNRPTENQAITE
ncbi:MULTISPECIES: ATP-binding protein [unclassified Frankia]|uniref:ATP-binding protein n=1 Tax=unclassified Frankia TaxID=2632575 RepID=UPI002AD4C594|nr:MULTISPECIES: ATP-binding protein [unclassified Frankia]